MGEDRKQYVNLDRAMLKELELSGFHSGKSNLDPNSVAKNGRGSFMLKANAVEKRKRAEPRKYPLSFRPMRLEEAKQEEPESALSVEAGTQPQSMVQGLVVEGLVETETSSQSHFGLSGLPH